MPLYEYECEQCGRFERIQKFSDRPIRKCPTCGRGVERLLSAPAIQFKGSGWYVTDYAGKGKKPEKAEKADGNGKGAKDSSPSSSSSSKGDSDSSPNKTTSTEAAASGSTPTK